MCLLTAPVTEASARLLINEVCYDPPGADAGHEYVELINIGAATVDLAGCRLEFGNGAVGPVWAARWTGQAGDRLEPGALFLIVDRGWTGPPADAEVRLSLQNGPDAIRLICPDGSVDIVGWGALEFPDMYEGAPHPGAPAAALARRPDGRDTGHNAVDLVVADPTPGRRNWAAVEVAVLSHVWQPPSLAAAGRPAQAVLTVRNTGLLPLTDALVDLAVGAAQASLTLETLGVDRDTTLTFTLVPQQTGLLATRLMVRGPADGGSCEVSLGRYMVGLPDVRLSEVMGAPTSGGEWCELINAGDVPRNLGDLALRDEDGAWRRLPDHELAPGDCLLIAQDAAALAVWLDDLVASGAALPCVPSPPVPLAGWPVLNNSAPAGRDFADRLYLGDADGAVIDHVTLGLGSGSVPSGRSYERLPDHGWQLATATIGATPGCPPAPMAALEPGGFALRPNPYDGADGDGTLAIQLEVPAAAVGWTLRVYDLWGRLVRDLGGDDHGPGPRHLAWDVRDESGRSLAPGGYIALVRWRHPGGGQATGGRRLLVVRRERP